MVEFLGYIDLSSFIFGTFFLVLTFLIRLKVDLPQNTVLLLVGISVTIFTFSHVSGYFPLIFPQMSEELKHIVQDSLLFFTTIVLFLYGFTTFSYVRKVSRVY